MYPSMFSTMVDRNNNGNNQANRYRYRASYEQQERRMSRYQPRLRPIRPRKPGDMRRYTRGLCFYPELYVEPDLASPYLENSTANDRLRWTKDLKDRFDVVVDTLGGARNFCLQVAKPKSILLLMNTKGLSLDHIKSHLQKFRQGGLAAYQVVQPVAPPNLPPPQPPVNRNNEPFRSAASGRRGSSSSFADKGKATAEVPNTENENGNNQLQVQMQAGNQDVNHSKLKDLTMAMNKGKGVLIQEMEHIGTSASAAKLGKKPAASTETESNDSVMNGQSVASGNSMIDTASSQPYQGENGGPSTSYYILESNSGDSTLFYLDEDGLIISEHGVDPSELLDGIADMLQ